MPKKLSKFQQMRAGAQALLDERALSHEGKAAKWERFLHFWVLVGRSFSRNRCPVRASALAYASLLALIPMLAVVVSVSSTFLKKEGEDRIDQLIMKLVSSVTPPATLNTNAVASTTETSAPKSGTGTDANQSAATDTAADSSDRGQGADKANLSAFAQDEKTVAARKSIAHNIHEFIQNTRSGTLGA